MVGKSMFRILLIIAATVMLTFSAEAKKKQINVSGLEIGMKADEVETILKRRELRVNAKNKSQIIASDTKRRGEGGAISYIVVLTDDYGHGGEYSGKVWKIRLKQKFKSPVDVMQIRDSSIQRYGKSRARFVNNTMIWDYGSGRTLEISFDFADKQQKTAKGITVQYQDDYLHRESKNEFARLQKLQKDKRSKQKAAARKKKKKALADAPVF